MKEKTYVILVGIRMERQIVVEADDPRQAIERARLGCFVAHKDILDYDWTTATIEEEEAGPEGPAPRA
jgi:hypothetical protein